MELRYRLSHLTIRVIVSTTAVLMVLAQFYDRFYQLLVRWHIVTYIGFWAIIWCPLLAAAAVAIEWMIMYKRLEQHWPLTIDTVVAGASCATCVAIWIHALTHLAFL
jgi:hypothetical protein